jgi:putative aldouronate transport system permease protein
MQIAFKNYRFSLGVWGSEWVGLRYFLDFARDPKFWSIIRNTLSISLSKLVFCFPAPILLALLLNSIRSNGFKRVVQTISYLPHFVSWIVVMTLVLKFFSPNGGLINDIRASMGLETIWFLGERDLWLPFVILTDMWKNIGYGSILYLAALTGIDPTQYEAASIDGANGARKLWHITLPGIKSTIGIMFLMQIGGLFNANMEQVLLLKTPATNAVAEIVDTYSLNRGINMNQFDYAMAISLFRGVLSLILVSLFNFISRKTTEISLW